MAERVDGAATAASPSVQGVAALTRLLHLSSSTLPVGAFSYSQGLEAAADAGIVHDAASARAWIADMLAGPIATLDAPLWLRLHRAWAGADVDAVDRWNAFFLASRESAELRAEVVQMGYSLRRLLIDLDVLPEPTARALADMIEPCFAAVHALACTHWSLDEAAALGAWLWSWLDNQVVSAVRIVPLGQTDGQRMLLALGERVPAVVATARALPDEDLGALAPGLAWLSSRHETQHTRIFRS